MVTDLDIEDRRYYTIAQACAILSIHRNTLRRYTDLGKVKSETRKVDHKTLYKGVELRRLVETRI